MEASSSWSSPLSVNSIVDFSPPVLTQRRRVSAKFDCHGRRKILSASPNCPLSSSPVTAHTSSCSTSSSSSSSSSSYFGISISLKNPYKTLAQTSSRKRSSPIVCSVFERFTERAIKAVMFSQREAKALGKDMVFTQHLLLGLVAEDRTPGGFLDSGITIDAARDAVRSIWHDENGDQSSDSSSEASSSITSATNVPFSISTKRVFEAAVEYSRTMGYNFIAPEHIAIGLFTVDDGSAGRVLKR